MTPAELLVETSAHLPEATPAELFRMCMLLSSTAAPDELAQTDKLGELIRDLQMQLRIHADQHAAVASELDSLASTEPCQFHVNQLWTLIRAIRVQSQLLNLYHLPMTDCEPASTSI